VPHWEAGSTPAASSDLLAEASQRAGGDPDGPSSSCGPYEPIDPAAAESRLYHDGTGQGLN
jgi:hypothetical protein